MFPKSITTDITIYNAIRENRQEKWRYTQLTGVFFDEAKADNVKISGITSADALNLVIPFDVKTLEENKEYKDPKMFQQDPQHAWTIQTGDLIVKGLVDIEILGQDDLKKVFDDVYIINTVDAKLFGSRHMWHWEVGAS